MSKPSTESTQMRPLFYDWNSPTEHWRGMEFVLAMSVNGTEREVGEVVVVGDSDENDLNRKGIVLGFWKSPHTDGGLWWVYLFPEEAPLT